MIFDVLISLYHRLQTVTWTTLLLALLAALIAWLVYKIIEEKFSPLAKIPSPQGGLPLIGHLLELINKGGLYPVLLEWRGKFGPIVAFGLGLFVAGARHVRVIVYDKDLIKQILITESHKYGRPESVKDIIPGAGNGLFTSSGKEHSRQRKMINPAFSFTHLKAFVPAFVESAGNLVQLWTQKIQTSPIVEVGDDICHVALDAIGKTSFGYEFNSVLGEESEVSSSFNYLLSGTEFSYMVRSRLIPFYKYLPLQENLVIKKSMKVVNDTVLKVIHQRRMLREQNKSADYKDLLSLLLDMYDEETGKTFDDEELRAQVFTFMVAGHETSSTSISWTLYELAKKPEIQGIIRREIKDVLKDDEEVTWSKLEQLEYLTCVIKESLRLHSPASLVGRETNQTVHLGPYEIPPKTFLIIPIDALHLSPDNWEDPLEFIPERFIRKDDSPVSPYTFMPFSAGSRICIGNKFAMAEMKTILLMLMRKFQFTAIPGFEVKKLQKFTTKPNPSVKVKINLLSEPC